MNTEQMIEKLKKPELAQPLGLYDEYFPEEAKIIRTAKPENCLYWQFGNKRWTQATSLQLSLCYILKPGYEPEPEYEDCMVFRNSANGRLSVTRRDWDYAKEIGNVVSEPDFYWFRDIHTGTDSRIPGHVPGWVRQRHDVHTRFVKE